MFPHTERTPIEFELTTSHGFPRDEFSGLPIQNVPIERFPHGKPVTKVRLSSFTNTHLIVGSIIILIISGIIGMKKK